MDEQFWHKKWHKNEIGFHMSQVNPQLEAWFRTLNIVAGGRVFVPLCGKTLDIEWLLEQGFDVVGAELNEGAVTALFHSLDIEPEVTRDGDVTWYRGPRIAIAQGNIFNLTAETLGAVDAVYDRAALIALPEELRKKYCAHLIAITESALQLLVTITYDQSVMNGPPFSVPHEWVEDAYGNGYSLTVLVSKDVPGGLKGRTECVETVWKLDRV
ncbi:MAG: thiopurine S-methyltransferase [Fibrobacterales bacterium]